GIALEYTTNIFFGGGRNGAPSVGPGEPRNPFILLGVASCPLPRLLQLAAPDVLQGDQRGEEQDHEDRRRGARHLERIQVVGVVERGRVRLVDGRVQQEARVELAERDREDQQRPDEDR